MLPSAAVVALAGIAREALTNAGKHAPGEDVRNAHASFTRTGEGCMRERLTLAGGTLTSGPEDGHWRVLAEVRT